jgi:hypothetical protein
LAPLCVLVPVGVPVAVGVGFALVGFALVGFALMVRVGVGVADGVLFWVVVLFGFAGAADDVALAEALRVLVRVADGLAFAVALAEAGVEDSVLVGAFAGVLAGVFTMDFVGVAAGLDVSVRVGAGGGSDGVAAELGECVGVPAVALPVVVGDALVEAGADVGAVVLGVGVGVAGVVLGAAGVVPEVVGEGVGVVGVAVGVCDVGVGEGDGLGDEAGSCSGSHDLPLAVVAALAAVLPATKPIPEAAVSRTLPAISVTVAGRACAKRIETPYQCCSLLLRNDSSGMK